MKHEKSGKVVKLKHEPAIKTRAEHNISRSNISDNALKVLYRLNNAGFKSYLVGGAVRDLLLNIKPKDFDVVTDAHPEQIRELFRNSRLIGRRFRLAHVRFGDEIIEVSTFRATHGVDSRDNYSNEGRILRDNVYGDIDEDVWRRDFTVNSLLYNIQDFSIVDYAGGLEDLKTGQIRLIGDPQSRYREDPVRMLRAIRFATKLSFELHPETDRQILAMKHLLADISPARLFEEFMKLFMAGKAESSYIQLRNYGLFQYLFPETDSILNGNNNIPVQSLISRVLQSTDNRIQENRPVTPAFLIAAFLWEPVKNLSEVHKSHGLAEMDAINLASDTVISRQISSISLPRRFTKTAREIWSLQSRLKHTRGNRPYRLITHPRFRAAYDFLLMRSETDETILELAGWWTKFVDDNNHLIPEPGKIRKRTTRSRKTSRRKHQ